MGQRREESMPEPSYVQEAMAEMIPLPQFD